MPRLKIDVKALERLMEDEEPPRKVVRGTDIATV